MSVDQRILRDNHAALWPLALAVAGGFGAAAAIVLFLILLSRVVAGVFLDGRTLADVLPAVGLMLALLLIRGGLLAAQEVLAQRAAAETKRATRDRLVSHLHALGPLFVRGQRAGELANTVVGGVEALDGYMAHYQPARFLAGLVPAMVLLLVLWIDPWTTLVLLFAGPILILLLMFIGQRTRILAEQRFDDLSWMSAYFLDMLRGLPTLKQFNRSREQAGNIAAISRQFGRTTMDVLRTAFQTSLVLEWGATAATALVAVEVSLRLMAGLLPFWEAFAVLLLTPEFFLPLRQLALQYHVGTEGKAAAKRIYALLDEPLPGGDRQTGTPPAVTDADIRFEQVHLSYDERRPALDGLNLRLRAGRATALIGTTGAGKSSVASLLLRFAEPANGAIYVGDCLLANLDAASWRQQLAWVPQTPYLFHTSVADNIRLGRPDATDAEVAAAARAAHAHEFIMALPEGYDTVIGEDGARLSGGQRQRVAIARAFLRDAPVLILDEATSQLDSDSEEAVIAALKQLMAGRTALLIAHRPAMAHMADDCVMLANGRVIDTGRSTSPNARAFEREGAVPA